MATWTYDEQVKVGRLELSDAMVAVTRRLNDWVLMDLDADGQVVGIEVLAITDPDAATLTTD